MSHGMFCVVVKRKFHPVTVLNIFYCSLRTYFLSVQCSSESCFIFYKLLVWQDDCARWETEFRGKIWKATLSSSQYTVWGFSMKNFIIWIAKKMRLALSFISCKQIMKGYKRNILDLKIESEYWTYPDPEQGCLELMADIWEALHWQ